MKMKTRWIVLVLVAVVCLTGCSGLSKTEQRVLSGGAIGAGAGAVTSAIVGGPIIVGTAVGAAAGAVGGVVVDEIDKANSK